MNITKHKDHYLLNNEHGEYHLSIEDYKSLGEQGAIDKATKEINKKLNSQYHNKTINFDQARELGFCEYGIKDFCTQLKLDTSKEYQLSELQSKLTLEVFKEYPNECIKLFSKDVINKFGGVNEILKNNKDSKTFYFIIDNFIEDDILHKLSVKAAYYSLNNYEKLYPDDNRPRKAIEAKEAYIRGEITKEELRSARLLAESAAESAAFSAAYSAWSAVRSAELAAESAWSAAYSARSAAWSAAYSAADSAVRSARSAARSAAYDYFSKELIALLKGTNETNF